MMGMGMGQMTQHAYPAQTYAHDGLARPGASQGDYLSNYTHPHPHALPNPFDGGERAMPMPMMEVPLSPGLGLGVQGQGQKVLKVCLRPFSFFFFFFEREELTGFRSCFVGCERVSMSSEGRASVRRECDG
jgi:hypothetical protein